MTHSLHRTGSAESLKNDFVLIARPAIGLNEAGAAARVRRFLEIVFEAGPTNLGSLESGGTIAGGLDQERVLAELDDRSGIRCAFASREKLVAVLKKVKAEELGISVTVSGIVEDVFSICDEVGLEPHSINVSLGVHGNRTLLADESVRELTTMCGHALIASSLVSKAMADVREGRSTPTDASIECGKACACGLFNLERAEAIFGRLQGLRD